MRQLFFTVFPLGADTAHLQTVFACLAWLLFLLCGESKTLPQVRGRAMFALQSHITKEASDFSKASFGAENETRTRDPNLGKVVLYQLSYFRIVPEWDCKGRHFF